MNFEWDESKNQRNIRERGLDFADAREMFDGPMLTASDDRQDYGEHRQIGLGYVQKRMMVVVFTRLPSGVIRIISFRKANAREQSKYQQTVAD